MRGHPHTTLRRCRLLYPAVLLRACENALDTLRFSIVVPEPFPLADCSPCSEDTASFFCP